MAGGRRTRGSCGFEQFLETEIENFPNFLLCSTVCVVFRCFIFGIILFKEPTVTLSGSCRYFFDNLMIPCEKVAENIRVCLSDGKNFSILSN